MTDNPLVISMDEEAGVVVARLCGSITARDIERARAGIPKQRGWSPGLAQIFDFTHVGALALTTAEIRAAARAMHKGATRVILVAKRGSVAYGLARMIQAWAAPGVYVVESMGRARELAMVSEHAVHP